MAEDVLAEAVEHHEAGRLKKAERLYKNVLKSNPRNSVALNLLGVLNYQGGRHGKAVSINPDYAFAHFNLGNSINTAASSAKPKPPSGKSWR